MPTYLDTILTAHRAAAAADGRELDELVAAAQQEPPARGFRDALTAELGMPVVRRYSGGQDIDGGCGMLAGKAIGDPLRVDGPGRGTRPESSCGPPGL